MGEPGNKGLATGLESVSELERKLEAALVELAERRQVSRGLHDRIASLELENFRLTEELASSRGFDITVKQLNDRFDAFQKSYACDVDKLAALLMEVQSILTGKNRVGWRRRVWSALTGRAVRNNYSHITGESHE